MMVVASILAASLTLPSVGAPAPTHQTLTRQAQEHARAVSATTPASRMSGAQTAKTQTRRDPKWDGALKGAAIGGFAGLVVGLIAEDKHGSASFGFHVVPTATVVGAGIGAATGLIIDLVRQ